MDNINYGIKCDVTNCRHNCCGKNCQLDSIKVTCDGEHCTACDSFSEKNG